MTIEQAVRIFKVKYPAKKPNGYWKDGNDYILNTESEYGSGYSGEICQYLIRANGDIQPTNPMRNETIIDYPMTKLY